MREEAYLPFMMVDRIKILGIVFENGKSVKDFEQNWTGKIEEEEKKYYTATE